MTSVLVIFANIQYLLKLEKRSFSSYLIIGMYLQMLTAFDETFNQIKQ